MHPSKSSPKSSRRKLTVASVVAAAVVVCGAWGVAHSRNKGPAIPKELTAKQLAAKAEEDPTKVFEQVRAAMESGDLSDEQRRAVMDNARAVMEVQMDKRVEEYFTASEAQRNDVLDRHINELQVRMKEMQQRRAERGEGEVRRPGEQRPDGPGTPGAGPGPAGPGMMAATPPGGPGMGRPPGPRPEPSREDRRMRSESRDPDRSARRMAYFAAVRQRAEQRGIEMPFGPARGR